MRVHEIQAGLSWAFLLEDESALYLVDAGSPGQEEVFYAYLDRFPGKPLRWIFLTHAHFDHYGCAASLRERTGARIAIHRADAEALRAGSTDLGEVKGKGRFVRPLLPLAEWYYRPEGIEPDLCLSDGDFLDGLGGRAEVLHTPGHTFGSSTLLLEGGAALAGDLLSTTGGPHAQRYFAQDWRALAQSVNRLKSRHLEIIYVGHGGRAMKGSELQALLV